MSHHQTLMNISKEDWWALHSNLNTWISFNLGWSRVVLQGTSYTALTSPEDSYMAEMLNLLPQSENLDPHKIMDSTQLTTMLIMLTDVLKSHHTQLPSVPSQCNIVLCMFRCLRAMHSNVSGSLMSSYPRVDHKGPGVCLGPGERNLSLGLYRPTFPPGHLCAFGSR